MSSIRYSLIWNQLSVHRQLNLYYLAISKIRF